MWNQPVSISGEMVKENGPGGHYILKNKPDTERSTTLAHTYMEYKNVDLM
jgi:hypothetical protein